jgi:hypothetical protein
MTAITVTAVATDAEGNHASSAASATVGPAAPTVTFGSWDNERGQDGMESAMKTSISFSGQLNGFQRGYSGNAHPDLFANSAIAQATSWNNAGMLNTKLDWATLAGGGYDSLITGFYNSWPAAVRGWVTINHEPENDGNTDSASYIAGVARYVSVAASRIRARGLAVGVGGCLMGFSWAPGSTAWQTWKWWEAIAAVDRPQTVFMLDQYAKTLPGPPIVGEDIASGLPAIFQPARDSGITRFALLETALDRRRKNHSDQIIGTDQTIADWLPGFATALAAIPGLEAVCHFHSATGPASQYAQLNTVALPVWAGIVRDGRRG